jgi:hypothetical protein
MVHCGYEQSIALSGSPRDMFQNFAYNFGAKPKPYYAGRSVNAFNGVSIGKGHLAEAKAAINPPAGGCGSGDASQREELLAKIAKKNTES